MKLLKKRISKSLLVTTALLGSGMTSQVALAEQVYTPSTDTMATVETAKDSTNLVDALTMEINQETLELNQLKTRLNWVPGHATVEKINLENKIKAKEQLQKNAKEKLSAEKERIAEEARKVEEARKTAEEARKAAEAKQTFTNNILAAQNTGVAVASSYAPNVTAYSNTYPWGQCTWGVSMMADWVGPYWGNANQWASSAAAEGYVVGDAPVAGAIIVWLNGVYGHVGMVTDVDANGNIQILEANYGGSADAADPRGIGNYRGWFNPISTGTVKYIYPKV